jgi:hypothetical protein
VIDRILFETSRAEETATYGEVDFRASPGRLRLHGRPHDCEELRRQPASTLRAADDADGFAKVDLGTLQRENIAEP